MIAAFACSWGGYGHVSRGIIHPKAQGCLDCIRSGLRIDRGVTRAPFSYCLLGHAAPRTDLSAHESMMLKTIAHASALCGGVSLYMRSRPYRNNIIHRNLARDDGAEMSVPNCQRLGFARNQIRLEIMPNEHARRFSRPRRHARQLRR